MDRPTAWASTEHGGALQYFPGAERLGQQHRHIRGLVPLTSEDLTPGWDPPDGQSHLCCGVGQLRLGSSTGAPLAQPLQWTSTFNSVDVGVGENPFEKVHIAAPRPAVFKVDAALGVETTELPPPF